MKYLVIIILLTLICIFFIPSNTSAQTANPNIETGQKNWDPEKFLFWINGGYGLPSIDEKTGRKRTILFIIPDIYICGNIGIYCSPQGKYVAAFTVNSVNVLNAEKFNHVDRIVDRNLLFGIIKTNHWQRFMVAAGPSFVKVKRERVHYDNEGGIEGKRAIASGIGGGLTIDYVENKYSNCFGLGVEARVSVFAFHAIGAGVGFFANFNEETNYGGVNVNISIGKQ